MEDKHRNMSWWWRVSELETCCLRGKRSHFNVHFTWVISFIDLSILLKIMLNTHCTAGAVPKHFICIISFLSINSWAGGILFFLNEETGSRRINNLPKVSKWDQDLNSVFLTSGPIRCDCYTHFFNNKVLVEGDAWWVLVVDDRGCSAVKLGSIKHLLAGYWSSLLSVGGRSFWRAFHWKPLKKKKKSPSLLGGPAFLCRLWYLLQRGVCVCVSVC